MTSTATPTNSVRKISAVHNFKVAKRTEGDGMEEETSKLSDINERLEDNEVIKKISSTCELPVFPKLEKLPKIPGQVHMISNAVHKRNDPNFLKGSYRKEPKFVPYEPYKAAVNPIIPTKKSSKTATKKTQQANLKTYANNAVDNCNNIIKCSSDPKAVSTATDNNSSPANGNPNAKSELEIELSRLKIENYELESQLKFQAQVNGELKKLLVAAVGEDIELRVQSLTEDKLQLAKQLVKTAKTLSTHQEQIEWLAGQCEVWRSKFLASSVLIEDLARWKAGLCQKVKDYENVLKSLLEERKQMKINIYHTYEKVTVLQNRFNLDPDIGRCVQNDKIPETMVDMCLTNYHLTNVLMNQLLGKEAQKDQPEQEYLTGVKLSSDAEIRAEELLMQPMLSFEKTDIACTAVMMGASIALSSSSPHCAHCNGSIKTV